MQSPSPMPPDSRGQRTRRRPLRPTQPRRPAGPFEQLRVYGFHLTDDDVELFQKQNYSDIFGQVLSMTAQLRDGLWPRATNALVVTSKDGLTSHALVLAINYSLETMELPTEEQVAEIMRVLGLPRAPDWYWLDTLSKF
ncbi:hypothetical protein MPER_10307 [Moniliophthora perniciosa FA553]|nr:hypothetical protein MPER_10307 [Moniliophthora perniciosa FA553]